MIELSDITNEKSKLHKDVLKLKTLICIQAAHHYDTALLYKESSKNTSLTEAEEVSKFINRFIPNANKKTNPYEFIRVPEVEINKAIDEYNRYKELLLIYPDEVRLIESFVKWYVHSGPNRSTAEIKFNVLFISFIGELMTLKSIHKLTQKDCDEAINIIMNQENIYFSFNMIRIKRAFIQAYLKMKEIKGKVEARQMV